MKKISVIVPAYNAEKTILPCLSSIKNQTYGSIEIIVVNDGSTDKTGDILDEYAKSNVGIKVIHKSNGGVSSARNIGMNAADGDYIGFVDSDDWIEPNMYEELVRAMEGYDAQLVSCDLFCDAPEVSPYTVYSEDKSEDDTVRTVENPYREVIDTVQISGYLLNKLFKKECIGRLSMDESIAQNEDLLFVVEYLSLVNKMVHIEKKLSHYHIRSTVPQTAITPRLVSVIDAYQKILTCYRQKAPSLAWLPEKNLLKIFLNFKGRVKIQAFKDKDFIRKVNDGIKLHFRAVMFSRSVSLTEKINILLTRMFPSAMLKIKNKALTERHKNGQWEE